MKRLLVLRMVGKQLMSVSFFGEHPLSEVARADIMDRAVALIDLDSLPHRPPSVGVVLVDLESHVYSVAYATTYARKLRFLDLGEAIFHDVEVVLLDGSLQKQKKSTTNCLSTIKSWVVFYEQRYYSTHSVVQLTCLDRQ